MTNSRGVNKTLGRRANKRTADAPNPTRIMFAGLRLLQSTLRSMVASTMEATPLQAASMLSMAAYMTLIGRHKLAVVALVTGNSMFPTLPADGSVVLCNPLAVWRRQLQPGTAPHHAGPVNATHRGRCDVSVHGALLPHLQADRRTGGRNRHIRPTPCHEAQCASTTTADHGVSLLRQC